MFTVSKVTHPHGKTSTTLSEQIANAGEVTCVLMNEASDLLDAGWKYHLTLTFKGEDTRVLYYFKGSKSRTSWTELHVTPASAIWPVA